MCIKMKQVNHILNKPKGEKVSIDIKTSMFWAMKRLRDVACIFINLNACET